MNNLRTSASLLSTKFYIPPPRANAVVRTRLTEKLLSVINQPNSFALLSGPAGFGKTMLLSDFIAALEVPVAWLSLDEEDNDPIQFWSYLITACRTIQSDVGESALALFHSPLPLSAEAVPAMLINDFATFSKDIILILDDYHFIQNETIHAALLFLIEHQPGNLHIIVSTRVDPPWPLARFRAHNHLIEISAKDLRFTNDEAARFLNKVIELNLSSEDVAALVTRTEGRIAGLQFAAVSMQGRRDIPGFIKAFTGSNVHIAEYLIEEVPQYQSEDVQMFLLQTSILGRLNTSLCEAITGLQDNQAVLNALRRENIFVIPLDDERLWFRYHQLFADLLHARLRQSLPAEAISTLHSRASQWYKRNGFVIEAVNHALAAEDFETAVDLIQQNASDVMIRGELATLLKWIEALPVDVSRRYPQIIISKAWSLTLAGDQPQVESMIQEIEAQIEFGDETPGVREFRGNISSIRSYFAMLAGDYVRALELSNLAEAFLPESSVQARSILPYTLGAAYRGQGEYEKAASAFSHMARIGEISNDLMVWVTGETEVVNTRHAQGRFRDANETARQALRKMADKGALPFSSLAKLEVALCDVLREQNELDEAHQRVTGVIKRMKEWEMPTDRLFAYLTLTRIQEAQGDFTGAFETLKLAKDLRSTHPILLALARSVDIYEIRLMIATHDISAAARLMDDLQPGTSQMVNLRDQELSMLARLWLAQGSIDEAAAILGTLSKDAEVGGRRAILLECLVLQARVLYAKGDQDVAVAILIKALALAEQEGLVRIFLEEPEEMQSLMIVVMRQLESAKDSTLISLKVFVAKLLDVFHSNQKVDAVSTL